MQVANILERLRLLTGSRSNIYSFTFRRGSVRSFYLIPAKPQAEAIRHNLHKLKNSPWAAFFTVSRLFSEYGEPRLGF